MSPIMRRLRLHIFSFIRRWNWLVAFFLFTPAMTALCQQAAESGPDAASVSSVPHEETHQDSEIGVTGLGSFGHYHMFANSWWSYLDMAQIEYDRHAWGYKLGARMDYSAAFDPMVLLWQPSKTDVWGNPHSRDHELNYGIGIAPAGLRMTWRSHKNVKPYFLIRGGVLVFDKKAVSQYASYLNWSLQMGLGVQFKVAPRWDARVGFSDYHFSDAFMTPSNPGLDSMTYTCGLMYHLRRRNN